MERDGSSRVDVTIEVCQYLSERDHCKVDEMSEFEKKRFNVIKGKLDKANTASAGAATTESSVDVKNEDDFLNKKLRN